MIDNIDIPGVTHPTWFFDQYISKRCPVKLRHHNIGLDIGDIYKFADHAYLCLQAGDCQVRVEIRNSVNDRFGKGNEVKIAFQEFLDKIESGDDNYYLTTQELCYSAEGQPSVISPPLTQLRQDFPIIPHLMGNLIVQNVNLWFGSSKLPSSSGLHHDFHDNLYIVLRGEKTFRLFSPSEHANMYTVGKIAHIHANGRINYEGQLTLADGSDEKAQLALAASHQVELAASRLMKAEAEGIVSSDIEDELDQALEASLEAEINDEDDDYDDEEEADDGSNDDDDEEGGDNFDSEDDDDDVEDGDVSDDQRTSVQAKKRPRYDTTAPSITKTSPTTATATATASDPASFSRVPTHLPVGQLAAIYPLYVDALSRCKEVTIHPGEALYLPAGWFHEVFSKSSSTSSDHDNRHIAFNYWFHPPDSSNYDHPYTNNFWANDWKTRLENGFI